VRRAELHHFLQALNVHPILWPSRGELQGDPSVTLDESSRRGVPHPDWHWTVTPQVVAWMDPHAAGA
jgi:hypothetical protein